MSLNLDGALTFPIRLDDSGVDRTATHVVANMHRMAGSANVLQGKFSAAGSVARSALGALNYAVLGMVGSMTALIGVRGVVGVVRGAANALDALNDSADATGSTVEMMSALESVWRRNGGTLKDVTDVVFKFNNTLKDANGRDAASRVLQKLGLDVAELRRLDPAEALRRVAIALAGWADDGDRARAVQVLLNRNAREAAPFLKDLAEKGTLNATANKQQAEEAERFNKRLFELQERASLFGRTIALEVLPPLNTYLEKVQRATSSGTSLFGAELKSEVESLRLSWLTSQIEEFADAVRKEPANREYVRRLAELRGEYDELARSAARANDRLKSMVAVKLPPNAGAGRGFVNPDRVKPALGPLGDGERKEKKDFFDEAQDRLEERLRVGLDRYVDSEREAIQKANEERSKDYLQRMNQAADFGRQLIEQSEGINASMLAGDEARSRAQLAVERRQIEERIDAMQLAPLERQLLEAQVTGYILARERQLTEDLKPQYQRQLELYRDTTRYMQQASDEFREGFIDNGRDMFRSWVKNGEIETDRLVDFIVNRFASMAYDQFLAGAFDSFGKTIFGALTGSGGGVAAAASGGDWFGDVLTSIGISGRASGGSVRRGSLHEVNERGTELLTVRGRDFLMMGADSGTVTPAGQWQGGGSSSTIIDASINGLSVGAGVSLPQVHAVVQRAVQAQEARFRRLISHDRL